MLVTNYIVTSKETFGRKPITFEKLIGLIPYWNYCSLDVEAQGLDDYSEILLLGLYHEGVSVIIAADMLEAKEMPSLMQALRNTLIIGSNVKYDLKLLYVHYKFNPLKLWDVEIADRRLYQGLQISDKNPQGFKFNLGATSKRHLPEIKRTSKDIRNEFIGHVRRTYKPKKIHYDYLEDDIQYLNRIRLSQVKHLRSSNKLNFIESVAMPLILVLRDMELDGFDINVTQWLQNIENAKQARYEAEVKLDKIRTELTLKYGGEHKAYVTGGVYSRERIKERTIDKTDLFGAVVSIIDTTSKKYFNYNSDLQIKYLFAVLKLPIPTAESYRIPIFNGNKITKFSVAYTKREILISDYPSEIQYLELASSGLIRQVGSLTVGIPALKEMIMAYPEHPAKEFIEVLQDYSLYNTRVTNYGQNYLDKIHPITNKLHTIYRQCHALNGRLQSGGGKSQPDKYNSQNIPRDNAYRTCFHYKGSYIITADLSGAEVVVMADKAKDVALKTMAIEQDDIHSPVAQACWRAIFKYRSGLYVKLWKNSDEYFTYVNQVNPKLLNNMRANELWDLSESYIITKTVNKDKRSAFKSITFGVVYGAYPKKIASTLNISEEEAKIVVKTIKSMIPQTFTMIETLLRKVFGVSYYGEYSQKPTGVAIFNKRSYNSIIVPPLFRYLRFDEEPNWKELNEWQSAVRNLTISGTQADMLKEAMVVLWYFIRNNRIPANILIQVHDELAVRCREDIIDNKVTYLYNGKQTLFPDIVANIMVDTANKYLEYLPMKVEYEVKKTWFK